MPNQEKSFETGGQTYTLRFTQNALYRLEKALGRQLSEALSSLSFVELQAMMWAGLEGARLKRGEARAFSVDDAGDIIDGLGGITVAIPIVMDAWRAAMPSPSPDALPAGAAAPSAATRRSLHSPAATDDEGSRVSDSSAAKDRSDADPS